MENENKTYGFLAWMLKTREERERKEIQKNAQNDKTKQRLEQCKRRSNEWQNCMDTVGVVGGAGCCCFGVGVVVVAWSFVAKCTFCRTFCASVLTPLCRAYQIFVVGRSGADADIVITRGYQVLQSHGIKMKRMERSLSHVVHRATIFQRSLRFDCFSVVLLQRNWLLFL